MSTITVRQHAEPGQTPQLRHRRRLATLAALAQAVEQDGMPFPVAIAFCDQQADPARHVLALFVDNDADRAAWLCWLTGDSMPVAIEAGSSPWQGWTVNVYGPTCREEPADTCGAPDERRALTDAERRGLALLAEGPARYSNLTAREAAPEPRRWLYWQTANALRDAGLADVALVDGQRVVTITDAGRAEHEATR